MHLQSDRKPNMARAHEARFDNINKEPSIYSKSKRTQPHVQFDKMLKKERHECLINPNSDLSMQRYLIKESLTKKNNSKLLALDKQISWEKLVDNTKKPTSEMDSYDIGKAHNQKLQSTSSGAKVTNGGVRGILSIDRMSKRSFL